MIRVLAAGVAELGKLETACRGLFILRRRIITVLADRALQGNDLAHGVLLRLANRRGWQATNQVEPDTPRRRVLTPAAKTPNYNGVRRTGTRCVQPYYPPKGRWMKARPEATARNGRCATGNRRLGHPLPQFPAGHVLLSLPLFCRSKPLRLGGRSSRPASRRWPARRSSCVSAKDASHGCRSAQGERKRQAGKGPLEMTAWRGSRHGESLLHLKPRGHGTHMLR